MKKVFFLGIAAAAMLASCSNDETVKISQSGAIGFSNTFVNNGTRSISDPSSTTSNLQSFDVYGFTQLGQIFDGTTVSKGGSGWTYTPIQYWVEGNTYTFGAVAPAGTGVNGEALTNGKVTMTIPFTSDGTTDLLHAAPAAIEADADFIASPQPVALTFSHQLSKVKFSFENAVGEGYNVKVTNIKITNAKETGTLTVADGVDNAWSAQAGSLELAFGNAVADGVDTDADTIANVGEAESYKEMLLIPTTDAESYTVTFTAELLQGEVSLGSWDHTATISGVELKLGYCYDFKAELNEKNIVVDPDDPDAELKPIEFTVSGVEDWNQTDQDQTVDIPTGGQ